MATKHMPTANRIVLAISFVACWDLLCDARTQIPVLAPSRIRLVSRLRMSEGASTEDGRYQLPSGLAQVMP